jgi:hypothetical protein
MIYSEAFRQIVARVNAEGDHASQYRWHGTLAKWTAQHDKYVVLDALTFSLQLGPNVAREHICADGKAPQREDVERAVRQIVEYFGTPAAHQHAA